MLKKIAMKAKNRLIRKIGNMSATSEADFPVTIIQTIDKDFIEKVRQIVNSDEYITNPLSRLMDDEAITYMTPRDKERYLLYTLDKFRKAKALLEHESHASCG